MKKLFENHGLLIARKPHTYTHNYFGIMYSRIKQYGFIQTLELSPKYILRMVVIRDGGNVLRIVAKKV
jgi:hypothetical protein